ncbi:hypothetical protein WG78_13835 [Amantichitinum ursilacus]|uniref:Type IV pilus modification protein PilV n=2 Tax=Amantichitinum ursilacus TaxID=857265 RepID=A0A0N0XKC9_9NEIS|nr:hypothetical protein WG78_13835 [Amantichitinum ursilacus]
MIEVLITLVIILIGVLGMAGIQMLAINNTQTARSHSLAAIQASSLAANMQVNKSYWLTATFAGDLTATMGDAWTGSSISGSANSTLASSTQDCASATCTGAQLAAYDLKNWAQNLATVLPQGKGNVTCTGNSAAKPNLCQITVSWLEKTVALHNDAAGTPGAGNMAAGTQQTQTYTTTASIY